MGPVCNELFFCNDGYFEASAFFQSNHLFHHGWQWSKSQVAMVKINLMNLVDTTRMGKWRTMLIEPGQSCVLDEYCVPMLFHIVTPLCDVLLFSPQIGVPLQRICTYRIKNKSDVHMMFTRGHIWIDVFCIFVRRITKYHEHDKSDINEYKKKYYFKLFVLHGSFASR